MVTPGTWLPYPTRLTPVILERVTGLVVVQGDASVTPDELEAFCRQRLAGFKTPKEFIVDKAALPRTPTGKVQKFLLVERFSRRPPSA